MSRLSNDPIPSYRHEKNDDTCSLEGNPVRIKFSSGNSERMWRKMVSYHMGVVHFESGMVMQP